MFITVEGLDASGKSTLVQGLYNKLLKSGYKTKVVGKKTIDYDENDYIGERLLKLNHILFDMKQGDVITRIPNDAWVYLNASWFSIVSNNYFNDDYIYLSDSWIYKRIARFSLLEEYSGEQIERIFSSAKRPDFTFFLDVPAQVTWTRREKHSRKDFGFLISDYDLCTKERFLNFQGGIYQNLCDLSNKHGWTRLDGNKSQDQLLQDVIATLCNAHIFSNSSSCGSIIQRNEDM